MRRQFIVTGDHYEAFDIVGQNLIEDHVDVALELEPQREVPQNPLEYEIEFVVEFGELGDYVKNVFASVEWSSRFFY